MQIGRYRIPILPGQTHNTLSNGVYLGFIPLVLVLAVPVWHGTTLGIAGACLAWSSALYHGTPRSARWAQEMDVWAIVAVLCALIAAATSEATGLPGYTTAPTAVVASVVAWRHMERVDSTVAVGVLDLGILLPLTAWIAGWVWMGVCLGTGLAAIGLRALGADDAHSHEHPWWHYLGMVHFASFLVAWYSPTALPLYA